jgi:hypothetical protein
MLFKLLGLKTSTKSNIKALFLSECNLSALPIDCIIICSDLKESAKTTLNIAFIETPVDKVPFFSKRRPKL